jgi:cysteine desulfuration protein SufE
MTIEEIIEEFGFLEDWEDKYRFLIDLGRLLQPMSQSAYCEANKVRGCASQVWLETRVERPRSGTAPILTFRADSDAHIVKGLIAILLAIYSGHSAPDILASDALATFQHLGLSEHLTPQRSNGVRAMVERIKREARAAHATT